MNTVCIRIKGDDSCITRRRQELKLRADLANRLASQLKGVQGNEGQVGGDRLVRFSAQVDPRWV